MTKRPSSCCWPWSAATRSRMSSFALWNRGPRRACRRGLLVSALHMETCMSKQKILEVQPVPKKGKIFVPFLANCRGILTHWTGKSPRGCPGESCKKHEHPVWKAYGPAQFQLPSTEGHWIPCVFEFTACTVLMTGVNDLRGQCWLLWRTLNHRKKQEVTGHPHCHYDGLTLPPAFNIEATVHRCLKSPEILWDVPPELYMRETAEISDDALEVDPFQQSKETPKTVQVYEGSMGERFRAVSGQPIGNGKK